MSVLVKSGDDLAERKCKWEFYDLMFLDKILAERWYLFSMSENDENVVNCCKLLISIY